MKRMRLWTVFLLSAVFLTACKAGEPGTVETDAAVEAQQDVEITLWTFPVGNWGNPTSVSSLMSEFQKEYPHIQISTEYLTYADGDARIEQALKDGSAPDLVLEGPERLVANWGDKGLMADLSDLWESDAAGMIYDNIRNACQRDGVYYEFPACMTTHCMAVNYDLFKAAGALQYIDEEAHTWTTEGFINAVRALTDYGQEQVGVIYCKNQSGDQGTRALVNNLYGGSFTDGEHTSYVIDSEENIRALKLLYDLEGITFAPDLGASDESGMFCRKELAMAFCWNVSQEITQTINNPDLDFEVFPMAFPTSSGDPRLQGGIWGFGVFDNGDSRKIEAAKTFIRFLTENDTRYAKTVQISAYWPVRDIGNIYENDALMAEYSIFMPYMGDYYQITPGWPEARAAWWQMLQKIGEGADVPASVKEFEKLVNTDK